MDHIKPSSQKRNSFRWRPIESWSHVLKKLEICYWLSQKGVDFYTECEFSKPYSGRADIVALRPDQNVIIEVLESEDLLTPSKIKDYPPWEIIQIRANRQFMEKDLE